MAKKMLIDATHAEECRVVVVDGNKVEEFDFESANKRQLAGNIYLAKVTRVEPSLQAAFVDYGGNRHGFLAFSEIHPDYYQIPQADREALLEEERAYAEAMAEEEAKPKRSRSRRRSRSKASKAKAEEAVEANDVSEEATDTEIKGMDVIDLGPEEEETSALVVDQAAAPAEDVAEEQASEDAQAEEPEADTPSAKASSVVSDDAVVTEEVEGASEEATTEEASEPVEEVAEEAPAEEVVAEEAGADEASEENSAEASAEAEAEEVSEEDDDANGDEGDDGLDASEKDENIESVADEDVSEEIRPRKPRARRYKIQEVIKVRQILLVQVVKEERGNKGAALTTYLSLAGRYCVLMPNTARGGGISRKITNAADRKKLKDIAGEIEVPEGAGLIIRTAGAKRTKSEIKRDYEYLQRLWEQIRELTLKSVAPAPIYEEGNLIKRSIRDLYAREIDEVLVEGEAGYRTAKDFMKMIMPSHAKKVKQYQDPLPLFARYQVESYLSGMFNPTVQLKSGGYIVIGVTEALVAIDVNSGRATKEGSIEETALKTNLEAAEEVARQLRLRDLAGLIVIDFIDMDERKNNNAVEKRMKDKLKTDRARIQVGRISGFGLMEMSRQRLRPGMIEATTQPCPHCHGTGLLRSDDNVALGILRQLEEEGVRGKSKEVLVKAPVAIANYLMNQKREHIAQIEARYGISIRIEADGHMISPDFEIERFKTATRNVPVASAPVISIDMPEMPEAEEAPEETAEDEDAPKKKRRRRRRRRGRKPTDGAENQTEAEEDQEEASEEASDGEESEAPSEEATEEEKPKRKRRSRSRRRKTQDDDAESTSETDAAEGADKADAPETTEEDASETAEEPAVDAVEETAEEAVEAEAPAEEVASEEPEAVEEPSAEEDPAVEEEPELVASEAVAESVEEAATAAVDEPPKPKRRGWWSRG
ncbi:ribonuclease E/G [Actibacterium pelagium]|uniref:Ribonuclease E n=1 Tax=Actibacterium pelagium TaxID=2029103 RepID=A0A917AEV9_9RHOB|nr:ribonuclease E/G [Actibacterium pelagium]GGE43468.1 hypothetical protein GCM10011517_08900 [Actibacterium pelagium]